MGIFDGAFDPIGSGILPGWLPTRDQPTQPDLPPWLSNAIANIQQGGMPGQPAPQFPQDMSFGERFNPAAAAMGQGGAFDRPMGLVSDPGLQNVSPQAMGSWRAGADNGGIIPTTTPLDANGRPVGEAIPPQAQPVMGQGMGIGGPSQGLGMLGMGQRPPMMPPQAQQAPQGGPGPMDRLTAAGGGFFNAGSPMEAIGNLIGGAMTGQRQDTVGYARQQQAQNQAEAEKAYIASGVPAPIARAMALNPEVAKIAAPEYFSGWKLVKTGSNPITGDQMMMQGPGGKLVPLERFVQGGGAPGAALGSQIGSGMLAPGVKQYDPTLTGDAYLQQFSPELQAATKNYLAGHTMPSGNPRLQGIANAAKLVAQTYAAGIGQPDLASDASYREKAKYRTELGSNSPNTVGGQVKAFNQGIQHADSLATKLEGLNNWNGLGIPLLAAGANTVREAFSNNQKGLATEAKALGQTLAGEVGKLFSGSAGGGVHEREMTRDRFKTISSGPELAGALEGTIETMEGGLKALEANRDRTLGPNSGVEFLTKDTEAKIAHIREIIARLKSGEAASQPAAAPALAPISGFKVLKVH